MKTLELTPPYPNKHHYTNDLGIMQMGVISTKHDNE